jgi:zinc-ribbon domain
MYCPRCGAPNTETTKFCRQCGLALMEVTNYVATGGTSSLIPPAAPMANASGGFTPQQKMSLAIILIVTSPAWTAVLSKFIGLPPAIPAICAVLMPFLIPAVVMYFRNQAKRLEPMNVPPPMPVQAPQQSYVPPQPQAWLQAPAMPVNAVPASDVPRTTPNTNPLARQPLSVIEDETKRLPN